MALLLSSPSLQFSPSPSSSSRSLPSTVTSSKSLCFAVSPNFPNKFSSRRALPSLKATLTVDSPTTTSRSDSPKVLLEVQNLKAAIAESGQEILHGVNLTIHEGEVHAIMGKNGSGKSTFSKVLVGHPDYVVTEGSVVYKGENLLELEPEERSHAGIFMSFQSPVEIPGVSNFNFLHMAFNAKRKKHGEEEISPIEFFPILNAQVSALKIDSKFLDRNVNEGFSGGEKKRNEILQLAVLGADLAILDEIDSGLDVDALQDVAKAVNMLLTSSNSVLMITHYQKLLDYIKPHYVHIMEDGVIVKTGDISLAIQLEKEGFKGIYSEKK